MRIQVWSYQNLTDSDECRVEVEVEGREVGAEESGASRSPASRVTLIPAFVPSFV